MLRDEADVPYDGQTKAERTRRPFVKVDQALMVEMVPKVGPSAWTVYTFLVMHADNQTGTCRPSQRRLVELTGLAERTVREALNRLIECGYVTREERRTVDGKRDADELTLTKYQAAKSADRPYQPAELPADQPAKSAAPYKVELDGTRDSAKALAANPPADAPKPKKALPRNGEAQTFLAVWCEAMGLGMPANYGKAVGQAGRLVKAGFTTADIPPLIAWLRRQAWLKDGFDLGTALSQADKFRTAQRETANTSGMSKAMREGRRVY